MVSHDSRIATLRGRAAITPLQASGMTAFYSATAILIVWLHGFLMLLNGLMGKTLLITTPGQV
jgi:hypothetical protein